MQTRRHITPFFITTTYDLPRSDRALPLRVEAQVRAPRELSGTWIPAVTWPSGEGTPEQARQMAALLLKAADEAETLALPSARRTALESEGLV